MKPIIVGVTGINALDNPGPGVGVARSLKEDSDLDVVVVGLAYDVLESGNYMDWLIDRSYSMPYPSSDGADQFHRLLDIKDRHGLDCVIPNLDAELPFYIRYSRELEREGIRVLVPTHEQYRLRSKDKLLELAKTLGISCPKTETVWSHDELQSAVGAIGLPVMIKGLYYEAVLARTMSQAVAQFDRLAAAWGAPVIVQEVVKGEELNVVGVGDGRGGLLGRVGIKKTAVTVLGKAWGAVTVQHEAMLEAATRFVEAHRWRGPFELECIVDNDKVYLIEINPRFPAWVYFATGVGVNLPARMLKTMFGREAATATSYASGRMFVRYAYELVTDMNRFQQLITRGEAL